MECWKMNEIKKTRKHQSNLKRNKELEISHLENHSDQETRKRDHNQTSKRLSPHEIENYPYNYADSSNYEVGKFMA